MSRKRNPAEKNRKLGNPGKRPIPDAPDVAPAVSARTGIPEPLFPLGRRGRYVWDHILASFAADWIAATDLPMFQRLCELEDDAAALRYGIIEAPHRHNTWRDRAQLLAIATEIRRTYSEFGLTPAERARLGVAQVHAAADMTRAAAVANRAKTYAVEPATGSAQGTTAPAPTKLPTRQLPLDIATEPPRPRDRLGRFVAAAP
jgi:hypothetical protein